ncbi:MAG: NADH-quinone oxidoreductase subunit I, partial [Bdellovibrionia bacterium]
MSVVRRPSSAASWYLPGILAGLWITLKSLIQNLANREKMPTLNYPEEKYEYSPRFKGTHVLTVKQDGSLRCTACMLCATNCPAQCITILASEHEDKSVEKFPIAYEIDMLRCVFCGFCEEACPVDAIRMGPEWQSPGLSGTNFVKGIDYLARRPAL